MTTLFKTLLHLFLCMSMCMPWYLDRGQIFPELVLFSCRVGPRDQTQAPRLGSKCLYLLSHLAWPACPFFKDKFLSCFSPCSESRMSLLSSLKELLLLMQEFREFQSIQEVPM